MLSFRRDLAAPICGLAIFLAAILVPGTAAANVPESKITLPTGTIYPLQDRSSPGPAITVSGTASFPEAAIRCYSGSAGSSFVTLAAKVAVSGGAFTTSIARSELQTAELCRLRAVPVGEEGANPPAEEGAFRGPLVAQSVFAPEHDSYSVATGSLGGMFFFRAADLCGQPSFLYSPSTDERGEELFLCSGEIGRGSLLKVDGGYAYTPGLAERIDEGRIKNVPQLSASRSFDESTGQIALTEEDPLVECSPEPDAVPSEHGCTEFVATGVTLKRTWQTADADHVASVRDAWTSTDGRPHSLEARYYTELAGEGGSSEGVYELPGAGGFSATVTGTMLAAPSGAGAILYKRDADTTESGDGEQPQGAVVYDRAPSGGIAVTEGSSTGNGESSFELPYSLSVPAGGAATVRMAFIQAFALPEVRALAAEAIAGFKPTIGIASPADGSTTTSATAAVTGTVADTGAVASVSVDGQAADISGGTWSAAVPLSSGANTITVSAIDQAGLSTTTSETITYVPPPVAEERQAVTLIEPAPTASKLSGPRANGERVTLVLTCAGQAGASCRVRLSLTTLEHITRGKVTSIAATTRNVVVGTFAVTIPAGTRMTATIRLNAAGHKLLARFHRLPAKLSAVLLGQAGTTILTRALTLKAPPAKRQG